MPALVSHWLLGKRVISHIDEHPEIPRLDVPAFLWGCQGPDVLFYQCRVPWRFGQKLNEFGSRLHFDPAAQLFDTLVNMLDSHDCRNYDQVMSYALGMCCHFSYDAAAHPYVYWLEKHMSETDSRGSDFQYHAEIESMLDIIMLRSELGLTPLDIKLTDCLETNPRTSPAIAEIYTYLLSNLYDFEVLPKTARLLVSDSLELFRVLNDPHQTRRPLLSVGEKLLRLSGGSMSAFVRPVAESLRYDYANTTHREWFNPCACKSVVSRDDFFAVTDRAEADVYPLMEFFVGAVRNGGGDFERFLDGKSFANGSEFAK